uniref:Uncharacterized protein n=1 Tax=Eucampia antarctica TaxID=49252 RepID=A0A7S2SCD3_9STRA|mmetsp:Transcript_6251/g.5854  ORF Transcript_6251/g.5854 Transcript_6251/m.5854 type:complete len:108 (+) Transcript_6251:150-473(+)
MRNPITSFVQGGMERYSEREEKMKNRVAESSINAQKIVDERHGPSRPNNYWQADKRSTEFNHFYVANSAYKSKEEGYVSSFKAARYYTDESSKRRDEILASLNAESS